MAASLGGCAFTQASSQLGDDYQGFPVDDTGAWTHHGPTSAERALAGSHFSVELVRFTDARRPRSMEVETPDRLIYQYDPDTLLQGAAYKSATLLNKYLCYRPTYPKDYKVEIDLDHLTTLIKTGTWWSGSWGRYTVAIEMHVLARRPDSSVVLDKLYTFRQERERKDFNGRGPSKERDRAVMYDMVEVGIRKIALEIGQDLQRDAHRWQLPDAASAAENALHPIDNAQGSGNPPVVVPAVMVPADEPSMTIMPDGDAPMTDPDNGVSDTQPSA